MGPCCEQTHAAFEVGLSLDQGQGVYNWWAGVDGSSQLRLCHTCIIDVMQPWQFNGLDTLTKSTICFMAAPMATSTDSEGSRTDRVLVL